MTNTKLIENSHLLKVTEIAKRANVSRDVVWHYIKKNNIKPAKSDTKPFLFDADLVSKIVSEHRQTQKQVESHNTNDSVVSDPVFDLLKTQIENLNRQIEFKDKQLENQRNDIEYYQKQLVDTRLELKNNQKLLDSAQNHKQTNAEENDRLKRDLADAKKQIEALKVDAEKASELSSKVEKVENASLWQRITKKFD